MFFLPITLVGTARFSKIVSSSDYLHVLLFLLAVAFVFSISLIWPGAIGGSPRLGFLDASVLLLATSVLFYGRRRIRNFLLPLAPFVGTLVVIGVVGQENPVFIDVVGKYFVNFTLWSSGSVLQLSVVRLVTYSGFFVIPGPPSLTVIIGYGVAGWTLPSSTR